jgi:phospholipase C
MGLVALPASAMGLGPRVSDLVNPTQVAFADMVSTPKVSPSFSSLPEDTIVVFFDLYGKNTVTAIKDSNGDPFAKLSYVLETASSGTHGLAVYMATDVKGGPSTTVTVQTSKTGKTSTAVLVEDVTSVAAAPLDHLSTATTGVGSSKFTNAVTATAGDIVLGFVSSGGYNGWSASGVDTRVNMLTTPTAGSHQTGADFSYTATSTGSVTMAGVSNKSANWIAQSLSLKPLKSSPPHGTYLVTFNESGLAVGAPWYVTIGANTTSSTTTTATVKEPNGTYGVYVTAPDYSSTSGFFTVDGAPVNVSVAFNPTTSCKNPSPLLSPFCQKIDHIVVILLENHAFDNYFGGYCPALGAYCNGTAIGDPTGTCVPQLNASGKCVTVFNYTKQQLSTPDQPHTYPATIASIDNGAMNGFYSAEGDSDIIFGHYNGTTIPVYWDLAQEYALGDDFFSSTLSYSLPNHWYLLAGQYPDQGDLPQSPGYETGVPASSRHAYLNAANGTETVQDLLNNSPTVSWKYYDWPLDTYKTAISQPNGSENAAGSAYAYWNPLASRYESYNTWYDTHFVARTDIFNDAQGLDGGLPNISWVIPQSGFSDHPPANISEGEAFVAQVVDSIEESQYWNSTAIFLSWDDYGGFFDNVPPPPVDPLGLSLRVPLVVISPYSREGAVVDENGYFESLLAIIEARFSLGCITQRDCGAPLPLDYFDFTNLTTPRGACLFPTEAVYATYPDPTCHPPADELVITPNMWVGSDAGETETEAD